MPEPTHIDPERLAALIDGRLGDAESAALRAELAHADEATLAAYADAVALAGELRGADAPTSMSAAVRPITSARRTRRWLVPVMGALAAGLVGIALFSTSRTRARSADVTVDLAGGALEVPAWNVVRSGDAAVTDRGRAVRLGVLLVQYDLLARHEDSAATSRAALIAALLDGIPGGSAASARWRAIAADRMHERVSPADAEAARSLVDAELVQLGSWLEAGRTAAAAGQTSWFDTHGMPRIRQPTSPALTPAHREALAAVERSLQARPLDPRAIAAAMAAAEIALAR